MAVDNTHTKYLKGVDKKAGTNYKEALEAQAKCENFFNGLHVPDLADGEEYDIPVQKGKKK